MEEKDRSALRKNRTFLIDQMVDTESVVDILMETNVLTESMKQDILEARKTKNDKNRALLDTITRRGPNAFKDFINALLKTDQLHIAQVLDPSVLNHKGATPVAPEPVSSQSSLENQSKHSMSSSGSSGSFNNDKSPLDSAKTARQAQPMSYSSGGASMNFGKAMQSNPQPVLVGRRVENQGSSQPQKSVSAPVTSGTEKATPARPASPQEQSSEGHLPTAELEMDFVSIPEASINWPSKLDTTMASKEFVVSDFKDEIIKKILADPNVYSLQGKRRAVIINNRNFVTDQYEDRHVSDMDSSRIQMIFKKLGISTKPITDKSKDEMLQMLTKERDSLDSNTGLLVLVILSYGGNGTILGADGGTVTPQDIVDLFSSQNAPKLKGVPKLVLIQACGVKMKDQSDPSLTEHDSGDQSVESIRKSMSMLQLGSSIDNEDGPLPGPSGEPATVGRGKPSDVSDTKGAPDTTPAPPAPINMNDNTDILIAMATTPDEPGQNYRSLFIQGLAYILCKYTVTDDFVRILKKVNMLRVEGKQTVELCQYRHSLTKKLYLLPAK